MKASPTIKFLVASLLMMISFAPGGCNCHHDDDDDDRDWSSNAVPVLRIRSGDGKTATSCLYQVRVVDRLNDEFLHEPPWTTLPDGTRLPMTCWEQLGHTVCQTAWLSPPGLMTIAEVPVGPYVISWSGHVIADFVVGASDLTDPFPAAVDLTTLLPPPPATLADPAVLDWGPAAGTAGDYWSIEIENIDGADDNGVKVFGQSVSWGDSDFSINLPDDWDPADPLLVTIIAIDRFNRGDYIQILETETDIPGYTRL